jgi:protein-disulfide isomerase
MAKESEVEKEVKEVEKGAKKFFKNYWAVATIILAVILLIVLIYSATGSISKAIAGQKILDYLNESSKGQVNASIVTISDLGSVYEVDLSLNGQTMPVYVTKDGKNFVPPGYLVPFKQETAPSSPSQNTKVTKTDKPVVNLYVFAYCPYGTQTEKALVPVYNLLKNSADLNIVYIGAMHGDFEKVESLRQLAILNIYGKDKLFAYLDKFLANTSVGACNGDAACLSPLLGGIMSQVGINKAQVDTAMNTQAIADLYSADEQKASSLGIGSSPTFTINGVQTNVDRSPAAIESAVCSAFNQSPLECSTQLSNIAATTGFGGSGSSSSASCS